MIIWLVIGLAALAAEAVTMGFVVAYFGVGAIAAAVAAALGAAVIGQVLVFAVVSFALLAFTRRVLVDWFQGRDAPALTNVQTLIGKTGVVTLAISNDLGTGQIRVGTEFWTARLEPAGAGEGEEAPVGARVEVLDVQGVTALVRMRELPHGDG